ncbi:MAG: PASTA domain-containing protein [Spirochaetes bacterium]|nr:PASTA domain-containing protein [Spirochaetota bacterium]
MIYFKNIFKKILSTIFINPEDTDILKAKKIIWYSTIGSVFIMIIVAWAIFILLTFTRNNVKVPMIEGDNIYTALNKLYEKRLIAKTITQFSDDIDSGTVFNQLPKQGYIVKKGRIVSFTVSLGKKDNALPDFRGFNLFELEDSLYKKFNSKIPFEIENPVYEYNSEVEKGRIIKQSPKDGIPINNVKKLKVWVSNGPKQEGASILKNYVGKNIEEVSKDLAELELFFNCDFDIVTKRDQDMIITNQSIGEGKLISEILEEKKVVVFKVNKYLEKEDKDDFKGTYLLDLPKKPIPYLLEVKIQHGISKEKAIKKLNTKGGVSLPILYYAKNDSRLLVYIDNKLFTTINLQDELKQN